MDIETQTRTRPTVAIKYYPPRLTDNGLAWLAEAAVEYADYSPSLAAWLGEWTHAEGYRRTIADLAASDPTWEVAVPDATLPALPLWRGSELGQALKACVQLSYLVEELTAAAFVKKLLMVVSGMAAYRVEHQKEQRT